MQNFTSEQQQFLVAFFTAKIETFTANDEQADAEQAQQAVASITNDASITNVCKVFSEFDIEADLLDEINEIDEREDIYALLTQ